MQNSQASTMLVLTVVDGRDLTLNSEQKTGKVF